MATEPMAELSTYWKTVQVNLLIHILNLKKSYSIIVYTYWNMCLKCVVWSIKTSTRKMLMICNISSFFCLTRHDVWEFHHSLRMNEDLPVTRCMVWDIFC